MANKCPGTDSRNVKPEMHTCPNCGYGVEIFTDESSRLCPRCKQRVYREQTPSCAQWCAAARQCLGDARWQQLVDEGVIKPQETTERKPPQIPSLKRKTPKTE